ncbi:RidA family protein [Oceanobacillus salinisoli]|uniref:RidA family protein n=1 Tax=Oceanobacillus salinisoli TaxID=2678611 RepID=UPI0012E2E2F6|nr:RidA family protein [Oceanobacillus salinisoli]
MKEKLQTEHAPKPTGPYSQGVKMDGLIFVSGQDGVHPDGKTAGESIELQTRACLTNIENILKEAGAGLEDIVHMTCHLADLSKENVRAFNQAYAAYFENVDIMPARITVGSVLMETDVEITALAYKK